MNNLACIKPYPLVTPEKVVCILGMHRSGTSCLTGTLESYGLHLGEVNRAAKFNKKGNRESRKIMDFHESLLNKSGGSWDSPPDKLIYNDTDTQVLTEILECYPTDQIWGFKDPRTLFTLELWEQLLPNLSYIGIFRHPSAVKKSLLKRPGLMPKIDPFILWLMYNKKLLHFCRKYKFPLINFDAPQHQFVEQAYLAGKYLNLNAEGEPFYDSTLRNNDSDFNACLEDEIYETYKQLVELSKV